MPTPDLSGQTLGDYELRRRLGSGGMADVYLALQRSLRREVALKILRPELARDERYVRRFHQEAQAAAALVHAHIVQIHEVGCVLGHHFIAQEYVPGENLRHLMQRMPQLPLPLAMTILDQVASALHRAGQGGIVHRDIKPENILLSMTGEVKVTDFGLARLLGSGSLELTQAGTTWGTPLYMSPEQIEARDLDPRSDIYSLGVTAFHMLAGRPPFTGETSLAVAVQHLQQSPPDLRQVRPEVPEALSDLVARMLSKSPEQRPQSAAVLQAELRAVPCDGEAISWPVQMAVAFPRGSLAATEHLQRVMKFRAGRRRPAARIAVLTLLTLVAYALGGWLGWRQLPADPLQAAAFSLPEIPRQESVAAQFAYAMQDGSERALQAVIRYFPPTAHPTHELYAHKAKLHLAYLYEDADRLQEALQLYRELADQELDSMLQTIGLIGQANVLVLQGERAQANQVLYQLAENVRAADLSLRHRQEWLRRLTPSLRSDFERQLRDRPHNQGDERQFNTRDSSRGTRAGSR